MHFLSINCAPLSHRGSEFWLCPRTDVLKSSIFNPKNSFCDFNFKSGRMFGSYAVFRGRMRHDNKVLNTMEHIDDLSSYYVDYIPDNSKTAIIDI